VAIKGILQADYVPVNKFELSMETMIPITITKVSGIEEDTPSVTLPDHTVHTGGRSEPIEFEIETPMHHKLERLAMERWLDEAQEPVSPTAKKTGTLTMMSQTNNQLVSYMIEGALCLKRSLPELDINNVGDMAVITWMIKADELVAL